VSRPLADLAAQLRGEGTPISPHVVEAPAADEDSLVVEAVREGYLLHYAEPRLLAGHDDDLALLAGDYLYALGIERLAAAGDVASILVLADLISDCARLHAERREDEVPGLWQEAIKRISNSVSGRGRSG
jgi:hypothetical protein